MAEKKNILTYEGLKALEDELQDLKLNRRKEVAAKIKEARVVVEEDVDNDAVNIGCSVRLKDIEFDEEMVYKIVGSTEADVLGNKISNESPVGMALIGSKAGDTIEVETPNGEVVKYEILEIQKSK